jgi:8-oxo-dGTP pyrophosphatase MutT (NUDIX family)
MSPQSPDITATPLPASTVILVRPTYVGAFEVLMHRRPDEMTTYAGAYVFPGGCVEQDDYSPDMIALTRGVTPDAARVALGSELKPELCLGHWVAAVRELFEEAGVHFFIHGAAQMMDDGELTRRLTSRRSALQHREISLAALLQSEKLACDLSRLRYFFHRTTPEHHKVRFDTRFYLAALPENQSPLPASEEVAESLWMVPGAALQASESGRFPMMPPTIMVLRTLAGYSNWDALCVTYGLKHLETSR